MDKLKVLAVLAGVALLSACNRSSDGSATGAGSDNASQSSGQGQAQPTQNRSPDQYDANNTGRNTRDRSDATLTSEDQGGSESDREITRQVRRTVTSNDQLSADAKNVKIVTVNGKVTLRGPVASTQEQQTIGDLAKQVQGVTSVDNKLEVKSNQ